jgi:hypothetical protein
MANNICGDPTNPTTANYPYMYFYNPFDSTNNRICVDFCPSYSSNTNTVSVPNAANDISSTTYLNNWDAQYNSSGILFTGSASSSTDYIGYDSYSLLSRICIPTAATVSNGFASIKTSVSSALQQGDLGNFISDVKNVTAILFRTGCISLLP